VYLFILCCSFSILCNYSNCLRQIIKKAELCPICKKIRTLPAFLRVLGIFLFDALLGTGTSYARAMSIFKIQMFILIHFTDLAVQNTTKQRMTKSHPQKSLSNSIRTVVKNLPLVHGAPTTLGFFMSLEHLHFDPRAYKVGRMPPPHRVATVTRYNVISSSK